MKPSILKKILLLCLLCLSLSAQADEAGLENMPGMKEHFLKALSTGNSGGEVQDGIGAFFKKSTGSNEPVFVTVTRIQQFERGCGRLHAVVKQVVGGGVVIDPWFEVNICPDGNPPAEKIKEMLDKQQAILKACKVTIAKSEPTKEGVTWAKIRVSGCPEESVGMTHWKYTGDCEDLVMPVGLTTNTPVKHGKVEVGLRIPAQCRTMKNEWTAVIESKEGLAVGEVKAVW